MRIVHFLWGLANGGAENLVVDLVNEQVKEHEVSLVIANALIDQSVLDRVNPLVHLVRLNRAEGSRNPLWFFRIWFSIRRLQADVIHAHSAKFINIGRFTGLPIFLTVHDTNIQLGTNIKDYTKICCISLAVYNDLNRRYPNLNLCVVNNGILINDIDTRIDQTVTIFRLVQVSRLMHEKKGQDILIKALNLILRNQANLNISIDFIGDGPSLAYLKNYAESNGVTNYCNFLGAKGRVDVYKMLANYDLLVQPSRYEGFGLTVAEAMAAMVPVIVSDIEGPLEIIENGKFGRHFKTGDAHALAGTIEDAIAAINSEQTLSNVQAARKHVLERYDVSISANNYLSIYAECMKK